MTHALSPTQSRQETLCDVPHPWWSTVREAIRTRLGPEIHDRWFRDTSVIEETETTVVIRVPSQAHAFMLARIYGDIIHELARGLGYSQKQIRYTWEEKPDGKSDAEAKEGAPEAATSQATPAPTASPSGGPPPAEDRDGKGEPIDEGSDGKEERQTSSEADKPLTWQAKWPGFMQKHLNARLFRDWFEPTRVIEEDDTSVKIRVPGPVFLKVLPRYLATIANAARAAGLPEKQVFFVPSDKSCDPRARDGESENTRQKLWDLLVQSGTISVDELKCLRERARRYGIPLKRLYAKAESTYRAYRSGRVESVYAVLHSALEELRPRPAPGTDPEAEARLCDLPAEANVKLGRDAIAHTFARMLRVPALTASKKRLVRISLRIAPGVTLELTRQSAIGLSPRLAVVWDFALSKAAQVPESALRYDAKMNTYAFRVPSREVTVFLGLKVLDTRNFKLIARALGATFSIGVFGSALKEEGQDTIVVFPRIRRTKGPNAAVELHMSAPILEALRGDNPDLIRAFPAKGLQTLKELDSITAGLVRILAYEFHGRKHVDQPFTISIHALHLAILGTEIRSNNEKRRFLYQLRRAVKRINEEDLLDALAVPEPRGVIMEVAEGGYVRFHRCRRPS